MGRRAGDAVAAIDYEIHGEMAASLGRVGDELERLIAAMHKIRVQLDGTSGQERAILVAEHNLLRAAAEKNMWKLVVQREAMGLRNHGALEATYPIPPRL